MNSRCANLITNIQYLKTGVFIQGYSNRAIYSIRNLFNTKVKFKINSDIPITFKVIK